LYEEGDRYLWIAGTDGNEPVGTEVLVDSSICGLLVEKETSDFVAVNPNERLDRYKGFLLGEGKRIPESELAVRIELDGQMIGVINLEHPKANVFKAEHVERMREAARFIAPFIGALRARHERQRSKELGVLYAVTRLLGRMASAYQHLLGHPLLKSRLTLERLCKQANEHSWDIRGDLGELGRYIDQIRDSSDRFCESIPFFVKYGRVDLLSTIENAIAPFRKERFVEEEDIRINLTAPLETEPVYASALLREHFYNIIDNSIYAVREALAAKKVKAGRIDILVEPVDVKDALGKETGSKLINVRIEDNGTGVSKKNERDIGKPRFTTKGVHGSGFGLAAGKEYMQSVGGDLTWKNLAGKGFIVSFHLEVFDPRKHSEEE
jgi:signal transduction histidine kinase